MATVFQLTGRAIFDAIRANPPMTREVEVEVARRALRGHKPSCDRMVLSNLGLVIKLAKRYARSGALADDLVQYGVLGLLRAIPKFNPERGLRFSTYAVPWILALLDDGAGIKEPAVRRNSGEARNMARGNATIPVFSLDALLDPSGDTTWGDLLTSPGPGAEQQLEEKQRTRAIQKRVRATTMDARQRQIVHERLMPEEPATLEQVAVQHGVCRERVRQLEVMVKKKLRRTLAEFAA